MPSTANNAAITARNEAIARLAVLPAEIATATRTVDAAADSTPGGRSNTKTFRVRSDAALGRTARGFERLRELKQEQARLTVRAAWLQDLPERPPATAELLREAGATAIRSYDMGRLSGWTRVVKVNKVSVTIGEGFKIPMKRIVDWR